MSRRSAQRWVTAPCSRPAKLRVRLLSRYLGVDGRRCGAAEAGRRMLPVRAYVGLNGHGKTWTAVHDVLPVLLEGRTWECAQPGHRHTAAGITSGERLVWSNVELFDPEFRRLGYDVHHARYRPLTRLTQLEEVEHGEVLTDEIIKVLGARQAQSLPVQIETLTQEMRRRDVLWSMCMPDYSQADVRARQVVQGVIYCVGSSWLRMPGKVWRSAQRIRVSHYDAKSFDDFTHAKRAKLKAEGRQHFWRPGHVTDLVYDSWRPVGTLAVATEGGMCMGCGGRRSLPRCGCTPEPTSLPEGFVEEYDSRGARRRRRAEDGEAGGVVLLDPQARSGRSRSRGDLSS